MSVSRRDFLTAAGSVAFCAEAALAKPQATGTAKHCIVLLLLGGPSQLETWDPKPEAPSAVRGPFRAIATSVPGIRVSEHLPRMAGLTHRFTIIRSLHHEEAPVHETGLQLLQTGRLVACDDELPHFGAVLARQSGGFVILPSRLGNTGINISHGQGAGFLGPEHDPQVQSQFTHLLDHADRARYGKTAFGDACLRARQLVEQGTASVVVNMFDTVYDRVTWDCHADRQCLASTLDDYRRTLCPTFDRACATLIEDLHQRGLLDETLVMAMGEMGRTPYLNANGGRDHWASCWSMIMAGGGVRGGQVIGASDRLGAEPIRRPVVCAEVVASVYQATGVTTAARLVEAAPLGELFA
jgi:Protein of unknown function (DUF1501)